MYLIYNTKNDRLFHTINNTFLIICFGLVFYPLFFIFSASFSSADAITSGKVIFLPVEFSLEGYTAVFKNNSIISGYANTLFYTFFGTLINVTMTILAAYPLSRKKFILRNPFMFLFTFTMVFSGGLIPTFLLVSRLGMVNTRWALLIPNAIAIYNLIITRTYFHSTISDELLEASQLDGCNDFIFLYKIVLPLSKAIIAVLVLFYAVSHWNEFFNAFIYLNKRGLFPLQIVLREILVMNMIDANMLLDPELMAARQGLANLLKYSLIVVASLPVWIAYPFVQKYFVKGVMIGAIKG